MAHSTGGGTGDGPEWEEIRRARDVLAEVVPSSAELARRAKEPLAPSVEAALASLERVLGRATDPEVRVAALAPLRSLLWNIGAASRVTGAARPHLGDASEAVRLAAVQAFSLGGGTTDDLATLASLLESDPSDDVRSYAAYAAALHVTIDETQTQKRPRVIGEELRRRLLVVVVRVLRDARAAAAVVRGGAVHLAESVLGEDLTPSDALDVGDEAESRALAAASAWLAAKT